MTDEHPICEGIKRNGDPCTKRATRGSDPPRCGSHRDQPRQTEQTPETRVPDRIQRLADVYAQVGNLTDACRQTGVSRANAYEWMRESDEARQLMMDARDRAADLLERAALTRAVVGVDEPVYYKGDVVGHVRKYSDTLLIFLLKAARPEKFRENRYTTVKHEGAGDHVPMHLQEQAEALRAAGYDVRPAGQAATTQVTVIGGSTDDYQEALRALRAGVIDVDSEEAEAS